jgi:drug/metabolite transporter superfamily protein YnfA
MIKLVYVAIFAVLAALDWRTVRGRVNAVLYFGLFIAAAILAALSVWFVQDISLARLFS